MIWDDQVHAAALPAEEASTPVAVHRVCGGSIESVHDRESIFFLNFCGLQEKTEQNHGCYAKRCVYTGFWSKSSKKIRGPKSTAFRF